MSQENQVSTTIPAATLADIIAKVNALNATLADYLLFNLTPSDRLELSKMGDKTIAFVQKSLEYAENNPTLVPGYLDISEAKKDFCTFTGFKQRIETSDNASACYRRHGDGSWQRSI